MQTGSGLSPRTGNFDNWIICSDGPHIAALRKHGITVIALNTPRNISPAALLVYFVKLIRVLRKERFDLVHTHGSIPGLLGRLAVRMAGTSVLVHTVHGYHFHDNMNRIKAWGFVQVEKLGAFFCDLILCQNYQDADETVRFGIARASKVRYVGNGIDLRTFDAPVRDTGASDKVVIGCIARLEPVKKPSTPFSPQLNCCEPRLKGPFRSGYWAMAT